MDPFFPNVDHENAVFSGINCDLDFFSTLDENPKILQDAPPHESQLSTNSGLEIDEFLKSVVSSTDPIQKEDILILEESSHIQSENAKLKRIIKELKLKNLKQGSLLAWRESKLAEKWSALEAAKSELETMKVKCQLFETENVALKSQEEQFELSGPG